jgi:hypothetical protein
MTGVVAEEQGANGAPHEGGQAAELAAHGAAGSLDAQDVLPKEAATVFERPAEETALTAGRMAFVYKVMVGYTVAIKVGSGLGHVCRLMGN